MDFKAALASRFKDFFSVVATEKGDWTVKGFIDVYKNIYTISIDTKVISKIVELMIFPIIVDFARTNGLQLILANHQNHYPDVTFISTATGEKIALDLKSTYRITDSKVNGMTLGAFTGYFRNRSSRKNISYPYSEYSSHYILGIVYSRADLFNAIGRLNAEGLIVGTAARKVIGQYVSNQNSESFEALASVLGVADDAERERLRLVVDDCLIDEKKSCRIDDLPQIMSVVRDFDFFLQEKWRIATDRPGSGNTKNIGSTSTIKELKDGIGPFTRHADGETMFNDYWMYYLTKDMAKAIDSTPPYRNIETYLAYKSGGSA